MTKGAKKNLSASHIGSGIQQSFNANYWKYKLLVVARYLRPNRRAIAGMHIKAHNKSYGLREKI